MIKRVRAFAMLKQPVGWLLLGCVVGLAAAVTFYGIPQSRFADVTSWASAVATSAAVIVALYVSKGQIDVAREAAVAERSTALELQDREHEHQKQAEHTRSVRLAHAFSRELIFARRELLVFLANIRPQSMHQPSDDTLAAFVAPKPLPDLALVERFADRLEGFKDEDAFATLTLLAAWQSFNRGPGLNPVAILALPVDRRVKMATNRSNAGRALLDAMNRLINQLADHYGSHASMQATVVEELPDELVKLFGHPGRDG